MNEIAKRDENRVPSLLGIDPSGFTKNLKVSATGALFVDGSGGSTSANPTVVTSFRAKTAGTGYSVGDIIHKLDSVIIATGLSAGSVWFNANTTLAITPSPTLAHLVQIANFPENAASSSVSATVTTGGTAQQILPVNASRRVFEFMNTSNTDMYIKFGSAPTSTTGFVVGAGESYQSPEVCVTSAIHILGATTGQTFEYYEI
jgi:hypothetical protein